MDKYSIYNPDWARGLIRAVKTLNNLYGEKEVKKVRPYLEVKIVKNKAKPKGNWVNGENIDKIKFPCFCSYIDEDKKKYIGILNCYVDSYRLYALEQSKDNFIDDCISLGNLIKSYDIHILKAKIIIFENEEE